MLARKLSLFTCALLAVPAAAHAADEADDGSDVPRARISYLEGELGGQAEAAEDEEDGRRLRFSLSSMVLPGDRLDAETGARVEVELPGGNFLRMSGGASAILQRFDGDVDITLIDGAIVVSGGSGAPAVAISTEGSRTVVDGGAMVRAELWAGQGRLEVRALRGDVAVDTGDAKHELKSGERLVQSKGDVDVAELRGGRDDFDRWNEDRERVVRSVSVPEPLQNERYEGLWALEGHGRWVHVDDGWYWTPIVVETWYPYSDGYWTWYTAFGWTWIPVSPWGYVTHHYGRWFWFPRHGWVWRPHHRWRGAWVAWAHAGPHIGWAPCDFAGRPIGHAHWTFTRPSTFVASAPRRRAGEGFVAYTLPYENIRSRLVEIARPTTELAPPITKRSSEGPGLRRLLGEERRHTEPRGFERSDEPEVIHRGFIPEPGKPLPRGDRTGGEARRPATVDERPRDDRRSGTDDDRGDRRREERRIERFGHGNRGYEETRNASPPIQRPPAPPPVQRPPASAPPARSFAPPAVMRPVIPSPSVRPQSNDGARALVRPGPMAPPRLRDEPQPQGEGRREDKRSSAIPPPPPPPAMPQGKKKGGEHAR